MAKKRVDRKARLDEISAAAFHLVVKHGLEGLTLAKVAREMGCSIGALTRYITSKDQLLLMARESAQTPVLRELVLLEEKNAGLESLRQVIQMVLPSTDAQFGEWLIWLEFVDRAKKNKKIRAMLDDQFVSYRQLYARRIKRAQELGEVPKDIDASWTAKAAVSFVLGIVIEVLSERPFPLKDQMRMVDEWIAGMLRPIKPLKKKKARA